MNDTRNWYRGPLDSKMVQKARRAAARRGWRVEKSRQRYQHVNNKGGLMLVDEDNICLDGWDYGMTPQQVIERCQQAPREHERNFGGGRENDVIDEGVVIAEELMGGIEKADDRHPGGIAYGVWVLLTRYFSGPCAWDVRDLAKSFTDHVADVAPHDGSTGLIAVSRLDRVVH